MKPKYSILFFTGFLLVSICFAPEPAVDCAAIFRQAVTDSRSELERDTFSTTRGLNAVGNMIGFGFKAKVLGAKKGDHIVSLGGGEGNDLAEASRNILEAANTSHHPSMTVISFTRPERVLDFDKQKTAVGSKKLNFIARKRMFHELKDHEIPQASLYYSNRGLFDYTPAFRGDLFRILKRARKGAEIVANMKYGSDRYLTIKDQSGKTISLEEYFALGRGFKVNYYELDATDKVLKFGLTRTSAQEVRLPVLELIEFKQYPGAPPKRVFRIKSSSR